MGGALYSGRPWVSQVPLILLGVSLGCHRASIRAMTPSPLHTKEFLSEVYVIDRKYEAMEAPRRHQPVKLLDSEPPELLWITGAQMEVVGPDGTSPQSTEFLCHSHLGRNIQERGSYEPLLTFLQGGLITKFPAGFGLPVLSNESLSTLDVVMNLTSDAPVRLRYKWQFEFLRDQEFQAPMKPLFTRRVQLRKGGYRIGQGRHENRAVVTTQLALEYDTTIHFVVAHLHAFGEFMTLRDLTAGTTLFTSRATTFPDRLAVAHVDFISSAKGIPVYKDHEYELVAVYNNSSTHECMAMGALRLYLLDQQFQKSPFHRSQAT